MDHYFKCFNYCLTYLNFLLPIFLSSFFKFLFNYFLILLLAIKREEKQKTYREDEVVATVEHVQEKQSPSPHHVDEIRRHENFLSAKINALCHQPVTV